MPNQANFILNVWDNAMNIQVLKLLSLFDSEEEYVFLPAGKELYRQGNTGRFMYVMKFGAADICVDGRVVGKASAGSVLGETTVAYGKPRSATVVATEDSKLIAIDHSRYTQLSAGVPGFVRYLSNIMRGRHLLDEGPAGA
jgi:CRP-like cAMP-binding protein